ncbi:hypothetical protein CYMTET_49146 [Cymbomonas tetramitiformis]|uniref:Uncharacterized protein n=1 Tax=Cymbomonas tetramitiformis TaxID=36881 RepID=A0AAE0BSH0_9CHLO|nr:hypothetical protein CYMTET_49146 [Cymbomonas tetramitiformis]
MEMIGKGASVEHAWLSREAHTVIRATRRRTATRLVYHQQGRLRTDLTRVANTLFAMKYRRYDFYDDAVLRERERASITERRVMVRDALLYYTRISELVDDANVEKEWEEDGIGASLLRDSDEIYDRACVLFVCAAMLSRHAFREPVVKLKCASLRTRLCREEANIALAGSSVEFGEIHVVHACLSVYGFIDT